MSKLGDAGFQPVGGWDRQTSSAARRLRNWRRQQGYGPDRLSLSNFDYAANTKRMAANRKAAYKARQLQNRRKRQGEKYNNGYIGDDVFTLVHRNPAVEKMMKGSSVNYMEARGALRGQTTASNRQVYIMFPFLQGVRADVATPGGYGTSMDELSNAMGSALTGTSSSRIFIEKMDVDLRMTNATTQTVYMTIYDLISKRDIQYGSVNAYPDSCWANGLNQSNNFTTVNGVVCGGQVPSDVGAVPYEASSFSELYRIARRHTLQLQPGGNHLHKIRRILNYLVPRSRFSTAVTNTANYITTDDTLNVAKISQFILITFYSMPANDTASKTSVGTPNCAVDFTWTFRAKVRYIVDTNTNTTVITNTLTTPATLGASTSTIAEGASNVIQMATA